MAALRKETAGGGPKTESPKPAAKKAVAAKTAAAPATGEKPSVQEMLKAAREGKPI
jgi:hypothetical protein